MYSQPIADHKILLPPCRNKNKTKERERDKLIPMDGCLTCVGMVSDVVNVDIDPEKRQPHYLAMQHYKSTAVEVKG